MSPIQKKGGRRKGEPNNYGANVTEGKKEKKINPQIFSEGKRRCLSKKESVHEIQIFSGGGKSGLSRGKKGPPILNEEGGGQFILLEGKRGWAKNLQEGKENNTYYDKRRERRGEESFSYFVERGRVRETEAMRGKRWLLFIDC